MSDCRRLSLGNPLVEKNPPSRNGVAVIARRGIVKRADINDHDIANTTGPQRLNRRIVDISSINQDCAERNVNVRTSLT